MTLEEFENQASEITNQPLPERVEIDELGNTIPAAEWRAEKLGLLSQAIRRCAWDGAQQGAAHDLALRCDEAAAHFSGYHVAPLPRFEAVYSGGILHRAIQ